MSVNTQRFDPYKNFKFRVVIGGKTVAGMSKSSALKLATNKVIYRSRDSSSDLKSSGRMKFEPITLERGVTHDQAFEQWANGTAKKRKQISIEVYDEAGRRIIAYKVRRCWVSEFQALPDLNANANAVAIQHMKLENEGWDARVYVPTARKPTRR
ncbi:MAG: phage tail protein [Verrucomicrobiota bacterium]